jgi:hypothetical protein
MSLLRPLGGNSAVLGSQLKASCHLRSDSSACKSLGFRTRLVRFPYLDIQWPLCATFRTGHDSRRNRTPFKFLSAKCTPAMNAHMKMQQKMIRLAGDNI